MPSIRVLGHAFRAWRRNLGWAKHDPETPYLADLLKGSPTCLHVGASYGRHTYVMTRVAPGARIHAFEPSAFTFEVLRTCLAWHGISDRVTPVRAAVADRPGEQLLVTPRKTSGRMAHTYAFLAESLPTPCGHPDLLEEGALVQPARVVTLDGYCQAEGLHKIDFIRMNIEGAELKALRGAEEILDRDRPHVLIEIDRDVLQGRFGGSAEAVLEIFRSRGYRMFALNGSRLEERTALAPDSPSKDYFFIHPWRAARLPDGVFKARMAA